MHNIDCVFEYNSEHFDGRHLLYQEFPEHYVYHSCDRVWQPQKKRQSFGCMYYCNPTAREKFYLRLLLIVIRGPQSFEHLCTVDNMVYPTYREAYVALRLTKSDQKWIDMFTKAIVFTSGESLRQLLITALTQGGLADAPTLWERFRESFCDNLGERTLCCQRYIAPLADLENSQTDLGLFLLDQILMDN